MKLHVKWSIIVGPYEDANHYYDLGFFILALLCYMCKFKLNDDWDYHLFKIFWVQWTNISFFYYTYDFCNNWDELSFVEH